MRGSRAFAGVALPALALTACIPAGDRPREVATPTDLPQVERQPLDEEVTALPSPPPAWEARRVTADARSIAATTYVVQPGDTLRGIADRTGAASEGIARANGLAAPFTIRASQRLTIPGGRYHLVRGGETGIAIARAYGVDWGRIVTANALEQPYILRTGQRVLIPGDAIPRSAAERAQAFRLDIDDIITGGEPALAANQAPARPTPSVKRVLPSTAAVAEPARAQLRGGFQWPVEGRIVGRFGRVASGERNDGIKIAVPLQTPIMAAADGVVAYVGNDIPSLGGLVILRHGGGLTSVYGHAGELLVQRGQSVKRGQRIARSGESGSADRPEVHFEIRQGRTPVDPLQRLPARS